MTIGEECAGGLCKDGRARLLVRSVLAQGATMEECDYL